MDSLPQKCLKKARFAARAVESNERLQTRGPEGFTWLMKAVASLCCFDVRKNRPYKSISSTFRILSTRSLPKLERPFCFAPFIR